MRRKYLQFPARTEHLVETTRHLMHMQTTVRATTDIETLVLVAGGKKVTRKKRQGRSLLWFCSFAVGNPFY